MWWSLGPKPIKLVKTMEEVNFVYDQLLVTQDVKKGKLVHSLEHGLERRSTQDFAYFNSRISSLGKTQGSLLGLSSDFPHSLIANLFVSLPFSLVIHSSLSDFLKFYEAYLSDYYSKSAIL